MIETRYIINEHLHCARQRLGKHPNSFLTVLAFHVSELDRGRRLTSLNDEMWLKIPKQVDGDGFMYVPSEGCFVSTRLPTRTADTTTETLY